MNYYSIPPLPISTITKVFHPRIAPLPNVTITEQDITELFYYGLLLPNVAHSWQANMEKCFKETKIENSGKSIFEIRIQNFCYKFLILGVCHIR